MKKILILPTLFFVFYSVNSFAEQVYLNEGQSIESEEGEKLCKLFQSKIGEAKTVAEVRLYTSKIRQHCNIKKNKIDFDSPETTEEE